MQQDFSRRCPIVCWRNLHVLSKHYLPSIDLVGNASCTQEEEQTFCISTEESISRGSALYDNKIGINIIMWITSCQASSSRNGSKECLIAQLKANMDNELSFCKAFGEEMYLTAQWGVVTAHGFTPLPGMRTTSSTQSSINSFCKWAKTKSQLLLREGSSNTCSRV